MILKGAFGLTQKPETQKMYTVDEIAQYLGCSSLHITNITNYYHIASDKTIGRKNLFVYDKVRLIKEYYDARLDKMLRKQIAERQKKQEETTVLEDHSLVTDKRCLDFNYWPDVTPVCFQECEV